MTMSPDVKRPGSPEAEIQQGNVRSRVKDDRIKRIARQHPQRDEPAVNSVEQEDLPPARTPRRRR